MVHTMVCIAMKVGSYESFVWHRYNKPRFLTSWSVPYTYHEPYLHTTSLTCSFLGLHPECNLGPADASATHLGSCGLCSPDLTENLQRVRYAVKYKCILFVILIQDSRSTVWREIIGERAQSETLREKRSYWCHLKEQQRNEKEKQAWSVVRCWDTYLVTLTAATSAAGVEKPRVAGSRVCRAGQRRRGPWPLRLTVVGDLQLHELAVLQPKRKTPNHSSTYKFETEVRSPLRKYVFQVSLGSLRDLWQGTKKYHPSIFPQFPTTE